MGRKRVDFDHFVSVKKKYRLLFELNQKFLLYKLWGLIFQILCVEGFFLIFKIEDAIFFLRMKNLPASTPIFRQPANLKLK